MKTLLTISALLLTLLTRAQDKDLLHKQDYSVLMAYTPKGFTIDTLTQPEVLKGVPVNSIGLLHFVYGNSRKLGLTEPDAKWLESQVSTMAKAFYLEGQPVMLRPVGGYSGCPGVMFYSEEQNGNSVTIINLCYTCTEATAEHKKFISIFNSCTEALLAADK